jgi:hypothetical protein
MTKNLKSHLKTVSENINSQTIQIGEINEGVKRQESLLGRVNDKLSVILKTKDSKQLFTIVFLWLILMFQIFILVFT